jgi:hypothetical protein
VREAATDERVKPDRCDGAFDRPHQQERMDGPRDQRSRDLELTVRTRLQARGENLPHVEDEAGFDEAARFPVGPAPAS